MQVTQQEETWRFEVRCRGAEKVYLVREPEIGPSAWIEMRSADGERWEVTNQLVAGRYRFRYFRADGDTFLNCGDHGLSSEFIGSADLDEPVHDDTRFALPV